MKVTTGSKIFEAFKWTGGPDQIEDPVWAVHLIKEGKILFHPAPLQMHIIIGDKHLIANPGDYVVRSNDHVISVYTEAKFKSVFTEVK